MKMSEAEQLEEFREEIKILRELIIANHEALKNISFTSSESGNFAFVDYGLKSAMLDWFSLCQEIVENEYQEIGVIWNRMEQNQNDEELLMSLSMRLIEIHTGIQEKERELDNAVKSASDKFALAFNIQLEENPLAEDLNEVIDETEAWKEEMKEIYDTQ